MHACVGCPPCVCCCLAHLLINSPLPLHCHFPQQHVAPPNCIPDCSAACGCLFASAEGGPSLDRPERASQPHLRPALPQQLRQGHTPLKYVAGLLMIHLSAATNRQPCIHVAADCANLQAAGQVTGQLQPAQGAHDTTHAGSALSLLSPSASCTLFVLSEADSVAALH